MNHQLYFTPEEAEQLLRKFGPRVPTAESIRHQAQHCPTNLGFPVTVIKSHVYIPSRSFLAYWGISQEQAAAAMNETERSA